MPNELCAAVELAKQRHQEAANRLSDAPQEAQEEWRVLQDRWTQFCAECELVGLQDKRQEAVSTASLGLVAEEFEKAFRRIAHSFDGSPGRSGQPTR